MSQAIKTPTLGLKGEFRVIVKNADTDEVRFDSGFQDNLITDWGIERYGGYHAFSEEGLGTNYQNLSGKTSSWQQGYVMYSCCHLGSGNRQPAVTDTWLQSPEVYVTTKGSGYSPVETGSISLDDTNEHAMYATYKYVFNRTIDNKNIAEIALSPFTLTDNKSYKGIFTRALIKNQLGQPTVLTVKSNEILEVYYRLWLVISRAKTTHTIQVNHTDSAGVITQKNVEVDLYPYVHSSNIIVGLSLPKLHYANTYQVYFYIANTTPSRTEENNVTQQVTSSNRYSTKISSPYIKVPEDCYVLNSKKQIGRGFLDVNHKGDNYPSVTSPNIKQIDVPCNYGYFSFVFKGEGIPKTNNDTLEFVFETSWDRWTGDTSKLVV